MATALQCPACRTKHRLDSLPDVATFTCRSCGQVLKVPAQFRARESVLTPPAPGRPYAGAAPTSPGADLPPAGPATTVIPGPAPARREPAPAPAPRRTWAGKLGTLLAWFVAVPVGLLVVVVPARRLGYLTGSDLLDLLSGSGLRRYLLLVLVVVFWALITASLVHLLVEGGRALQARRAAVRAAGPARDQRPGRSPAEGDGS